jgi:hypothetical protein
MKTFKWSVGCKNFPLQVLLPVAWSAILLCLNGCTSVPKPPPQFPAWSPANKTSEGPIIAGSYEDTGSGFSKDGKYLGQFSLTSVLQKEDPKPATNNDVVTVIGPKNGRLEVQSWRDDQMLSMIQRTYSKSVTTSGCKTHYDLHDGFVWLPLCMTTDAGPILPLIFVNYDYIIYLRTAEDGSLIAYEYNCESGYCFFVPYQHNLSKWYRFKPVLH